MLEAVASGASEHGDIVGLGLPEDLLENGAQVRELLDGGVAHVPFIVRNGNPKPRVTSAFSHDSRRSRSRDNDGHAGRGDFPRELANAAVALLVHVNRSDPALRSRE